MRSRKWLFVQKISVLLAVCASWPIGSVDAEVLDLDDALRATYTACMGIDDSLSDLKKMAGINTAITGVGTGLGAGATVVGIVKANKDKRIAELEKELERLKEIQNRTTFSVPNKAEVLSGLDEYYKQNQDPNKQLEDDIEKMTKQSKKLGN